MKRVLDKTLLLSKFFILFSFVLIPSLARTETNNLSASISPEGVISGFSLPCSGTNATALLLSRSNNFRPYSNSVEGFLRRPCLEGTVTFPSFDLNTKLTNIGGAYPMWPTYFHLPMDLVVKDTTGVYSPNSDYDTVINLYSVQNNFNFDLLNPLNSTYPTLGSGTEFNFDGSVWTASSTVSTSTPTGFSSVLFLPGLEASRLYLDTPEKCPLNCVDQLWEPNGNSDVEDLYLNSSGESIKSGIYTKDIIDETNTPTDLGFLGQNIYKSFSEMMDGLKEEGSIADWKAYAYDWRHSVDDIVLNGTKYDNDQTISLIGTLQSLVNTSKSGKVTIVSHSNGGLLAKALLFKLQEMKTAGENDLIDKIDNLVLIAVPQIGTPEGFFAILHGYDQNLPLWLLSPNIARQLAKNMPSAYGLLPTEKYFEQVGIILPAEFEKQTLKDFYGQNINTYLEQKNFVLGLEGRLEPQVDNLVKPILGNNLLLEESEDLHDKIDNFVTPLNIKTIYISGWGKETIAGMKYKENDLEPIYTFNGDKTVVSQSALYGTGDKYWLDLSKSKIEHKNITEDPEILDFIEKTILEENPVLANIKTAEPIQKNIRLRLSVHSPITLGVYDNQNNFTGKICDINNVCHIEENIPGSTYYEIGEGKYLNLGNEDFKIAKMQGTDTGTFSFVQDRVFTDQTSTTTYFIDIPVTSQTKAEFSINQNTQNTEIKLDVQGDGISDFTLQPKVVFDPIEFLLIMKKTVESLDLNQSRKNLLVKRIENTIKSIQNGKINKAKLKAENFKKALENKIKKPDPKKPKPGRISKTDAETLVIMLEKLLDNLN